MTTLQDQSTRKLTATQPPDLLLLNARALADVVAVSDDDAISLWAAGRKRAKISN